MGDIQRAARMTLGLGEGLHPASPLLVYNYRKMSRIAGKAAGESVRHI